MKEAHAIQMNSKTSTHETQLTKYFTWPMLWISNIDLGKPPGKVKGCVKHVVVFHPRGCHYDKRGPPSIPDFIQLKVMWTHYLKNCPFKSENLIFPLDRTPPIAVAPGGCCGARVAKGKLRPIQNHVFGIDHFSFHSTLSFRAGSGWVCLVPTSNMQRAAETPV